MGETSEKSNDFALAEAVKPCPFCGHDDPYLDEVVDDDRPGYFLACPECWATGPRTDEVKTAFEFWNRQE